MAPEWVIIRCDVSEKIGLGHFFRASVLAQELQEIGYQVCFVMKDTFGLPVARIHEQGFFLEKLRADVTPDDDFFAIKNLTRRKNCSLIIIDHYGIGSDYVKNCKDTGLNVVSLDDLCKRSFSDDIVINQNINAEKLPYIKNSSTKYLLGTKYALVRKKYCQNRPQTVPTTTAYKNILLFMGGGDFENQTLRIHLALLELSSIEQITIVLGSAFMHQKEIEQNLGNSSKKVILYKDLPDLINPMLTCDLFICAGGSVIWEACCLGKTTLILPIADNQIQNALEMAARNCAIVNCQHKGLSPRELCDYIELSLKITDQHCNIAKNAYSLVDGLGGVRIAQEIAQIK